MLCSRCGQPGEFSKRHRQCKKCLSEKSIEYAKANPVQVANKNAAWRAAHPGYSKDKSTQWRAEHPESAKERGKRLNRLYLYGITREAWLAMLATQNFKCAICEVSIDESASVDHDHQTGVVRGALCRHCNLGLGHFRDRPELMERAARYLKVRIAPAAQSG